MKQKKEQSNMFACVFTVRTTSIIAVLLLVSMFLPIPATAQNKAGEHYVQGLHARQEGNMERAFEYFSQSAQEGDARAYDCLAECYQKGLGVKTDESKAIEYYEKAAEQGIRHAQKALAEYYSEGTQKDQQKAAYWAGKAAQETYDYIAILPEFKGGDYALIKRYVDNYCSVYPEEALKESAQGEVIVAFVVNEHGWIEDVKVDRSPHPSFNQIALDCIMSMPAWEPGKKDLGKEGLKDPDAIIEKDGPWEIVCKKVRCRYRLPVTFRLLDFENGIRKKSN